MSRTLFDSSLEWSFVHKNSNNQPVQQTNLGSLSCLSWSELVFIFKAKKKAQQQSAYAAVVQCWTTGVVVVIIFIPKPCLLSTKKQCYFHSVTMIFLFLESYLGIIYF